MARRHSLRVRVAVAFAGLGALLSILLAVGLWLAAHDVSQRLMDQTLKAELEDYMARRGRNPASLPPATTSLRGYVAVAGTANTELPAAIARLLPGQHEIELDATPYRVAVADQGGDRYYILFNEVRQRRREQGFFNYLVAGAALMTLLSATIGYWLAGRVIAPVTLLAHQVRDAGPESPPQLEGLEQPAARRDEIGDLAHAFDSYLRRLGAFIERERAFAADASHELRTPLAVIQGAAEVLAGDPALAPAQAQRVARIERAAQEMSELIAALLLLAREQAPGADEECDAEAVTRACIERYLPQAERRGTRLVLAQSTPLRLPVAPALFAIVVANLVRNAIAHTENGDVRISLDSRQLRVDDNGVGIRAEELGKVFERYYRGSGNRDSHGAGIGLSLVKRICDRCGWRIDLAPGETGGTSATLEFSITS